MTQDTYYDASGNHVMKEFVTVDDGEIFAGRALSNGVEKGR